MACVDPELKRGVCVLIFCGLPASGKSSLAKLLCKSMTSLEQQSGASCGVIHIPYDKLFPDGGEGVLIEGSEDRSAWKSYRSEILMCVEQTIKIFIKKEEFSQVDTNDKRLQEKFQAKLVTTARDAFLKEHLVVLIDDNMYYKSMRYEFYQLAKHLRVGFGIVYVDCRLEESLVRNADRPEEDRVADHVVKEMNEKFEIPDGNENYWERNLVVSRALPDSNGETVCEIGNLIRQALENPVEDLCALQEVEREESRKVCSENIKHRVDQVLRKLIAAEIKASPAEQRKNRAMFYGKVKGLILKDLDEGKVLLSSDLFEEVYKDNAETDVFTETVKKVFHEYCVNFTYNLSK